MEGAQKVCKGCTKVHGSAWQVRGRCVEGDGDKKIRISC